MATQRAKPRNAFVVPPVRELAISHCHLTHFAFVLSAVLLSTSAGNWVQAAEDIVPPETFFPKPTCSIWRDGKEVTTEAIAGPFTCTRRDKDWLWIGSGWV